MHTDAAHAHRTGPLLVVKRAVPDRLWSRTVALSRPFEASIRTLLSPPSVLHYKESAETRKKEKNAHAVVLPLRQIHTHSVAAGLT